MDQQKMAFISSTTANNDWPQIEDEDNEDQSINTTVVSNMGPTTTAGATRLMEKPGKELLQLQQQALKCPRCDSSNTKFCYYNNYSLTQPRHFCKACKRYWTRGGTLRNVPVGGGCRRNKRVRRAASSISTVDHNGASSSGNNNSIPNPNQINLASSNPNHHHHHLNPLFYQPDHHLGINTNPFDQLSSLGLGFGHDQRFDSLHSSNQALFSSTFNSSAPTMASVLASKFINNGFKDVRGNGNQYFQNLLPFEDLQIDHDGGDEAKEVKGEGGQGKMGLSSTSSTNHQGNVEQMGMSSDPTLHWSSSSKLGGNSWHDPASLASSVSSLI